MRRPTGKNVALGAILLVNFLFACKYTERATPYFLSASLLYTILLWAIFAFALKNRVVAGSGKLIAAALLALFCIGAFYALHIVGFETLRVDRWSVIASFWQNYFNGEYVYFAVSHMNNHPGPMPFYFILALPFYLLGDLGYFSLCGIVVFYFMLRRFASRNYIVPAFLLVAASSGYVWEIVCRSNIFLNAALILLSLILLLETAEKRLKIPIFVHGVIIGLLLSTRNVFVIPYIIVIVYLWRRNQLTFLQLLKLGSVSFTAFALTFVPFVVGHAAEFMQVNPFVIQSEALMPLPMSLGCIMASVAIPFFLKDRDDVILWSGLALLLTIIAYFTYQAITKSWQNAFFGSAADISYLLLCVPFFIFYIARPSGLEDGGNRK